MYSFRDLKPANILLDRTLRAKLGDVGLARLMGHPAAGVATGAAHSTVHDSQLVRRVCATLGVSVYVQLTPTCS
jgi:serine/threonine protein kinase